MSNDSTFKQAMQVLAVFDQQDSCRAQTQSLIDGGHLAHLVKAAKENRLPSLDAFTAFLNGGTVPVASSQSTGPLKFNQDLAVSAPMKALDLKSFFKNRSGLWVYDNFSSRASALLKKVQPSVPFALKSHDLTKNAYDREIKAALSAEHEVDLWVIARMIQEQEGGKSGPLLNNGYANIFYVAGFVVSVYWIADNREWLVSVWSLDAYLWSAGHRVFVRN